LIGIKLAAVVHVPGPFGSGVMPLPGGGTGTGVPVVGGVGFVGGVGVVVGGVVPPFATLDPLLYVQPFSAAAITRIITDMEAFFILALSLSKPALASVPCRCTAREFPRSLP
jgi:hypothetical protein